jgi:hypothetical protein
MTINAGVGGWGTLQEVTYGIDHLGAFNPDIVVITFCGNDPEDDVDFLNYKRLRSAIPGFNRLKSFLNENSYLYRLWTLAYYEIRKKNEKMGIEMENQHTGDISETEWRETLGYMKNFHDDFLKFNPKGVLLVQATNPIDTSIRSHLASISNGRDLIYVDLYEDVVGLDRKQLVLPYDPHWSQLMHSLSARGLSRTILKLDSLSSKRENLAQATKRLRNWP